LPIQREQIETHLRSISSGLKKEEAAQAAARKTTAKIAQFHSGALDRGSKESQNISEAIVLSNGFDISNLETLTPEIERTMAKALPTFLVNSLNNLAAGQGDPNAQNVLSIYARLRDYQITMSEGLGLQANRINALNDIISVDRQMMLNQMLIGMESGGYSTANEASMEVAKLMKTSPSKAAENVSAFFRDSKGNSISPEKYVSEILDDMDPYLIKDFGTMAKLLAAKGFEPEEVKEQLVGQYNNRYKESKYVFDGTRGFNNQGRSRYALSAAMPDPKRESYFINKVENQLLSMGYTLFNHNDGSSISSTDVFEPVVLVPLFPDVSTAQQLYQAFKVIDEGGSKVIEPVRLEDGSMPAFNISDETKELDSDLEITKAKTYEQLEGDAKVHRYLQENGLMSGAPLN